MEREGLRFVTAKASFHGQHKWKDAHDFLKHTHRHRFDVEITVVVPHSDRFIEFIDLQESLKDFLTVRYEGKYFEESCEMIAEAVAHNFRHLDVSLVRVWEDGENSGGIIFSPHHRAIFRRFSSEASPDVSVNAPADARQAFVTCPCG